MKVFGLFGFSQHERGAWDSFGYAGSHMGPVESRLMTVVSAQDIASAAAALGGETATFSAMRAAESKTFRQDLSERFPDGSGRPFLPGPESHARLAHPYSGMPDDDRDRSFWAARLNLGLWLGELHCVYAR